MAETTDLELGGVFYRLSVPNAKASWAVFRRLAPLVEGMAEGFLTGQAPDTKDLLSKAAKALAAMTDADSDFVINTALRHVQRQDTGKWFPMMSGDAMRYQDTPLAHMLTLTVRVLEPALRDFLSELPQMSGGAAAADETS